MDEPLLDCNALMFSNAIVVVASRSPIGTRCGSKQPKCFADQIYPCHFHSRPPGPIFLATRGLTGARTAGGLEGDLEGDEERIRALQRGVVGGLATMLSRQEQIGTGDQIRDSVLRFTSYKGGFVSQRHVL
jgi:hypothetical protein